MIVAALAVVGIAIVCVEGWGRTVVAGIVWASGEAPAWDLPGVRGAIGLAVLSTVTGCLVLLKVPAEVPFWILAAAGLAGWLLRPPSLALCREQLPGCVARVGILVALALWLTVWTLAYPTFNPCDDNIAYIPFAHEILHVGGLEQPFSQRRIGTLGSWIPIEFWGYVTLGPTGALLGDAIICPLLAAAALLWSNRRWPGLVIGGAGALVAALAPLGRINLGPNGITVLMLLAVGVIAARTIGRGDRVRLGGAIVACALASQVVGFRLHYALVALVPVALVVLWPPRRRLVLAATIAGVVSVLPWSLAALRATGTALFPILGKGTLNPEWDGYKDPTVKGFGALFGRSVDLLSFQDVAVTLVALSAIGALLMATGRGNGRRFSIPVGMAVAALATIAVFPDLLTTAATEDSWRVTRPLIVGALLVLVNELSFAQPVRVRWRSEQGLPVVMSAVAGVVLAMWVGQIGWADQIGRARSLRNAVDRASNFDIDPYASVRRSYDALERALPANAVVAYAVDEPELLDGAGRRGYNLDILGANSLTPGLPYFRGAGAKLAYFRRLGITHLVTVDPVASTCLYNAGVWVQNRTGLRVYQLWAPYFDDWFRDTARITRDDPTRRFGKLRLTTLGA